MLSITMGAEILLTVTRQSLKDVQYLLILVGRHLFLMKSNTMMSMGLGSHEVVELSSGPSASASNGFRLGSKAAT